MCNTLRGEEVLVYKMSLNKNSLLFEFIIKFGRNSDHISDT